VNAGALKAVTALGEQELHDELAALGAKPYRARQILARLYRRLATSWDEYTELPVSLREKLKQRLVPVGSVVESVASARDGTDKLLVRLSDGEAVEAVKIPAKDRLTACVSTQVGCRRGCAFCASRAVPFKRDLAAHEMVEQAIHVAARADGALTHVVFMGVGEPLDNAENVLAAIAALNAKRGLNIGMRRMTISTVGVPGRLRELARLGAQFNLAISLHAPDDELRAHLIPSARRYPLKLLIADAKHYFEKTRREITFEYLLLGGVNDSARCAERLGRLLRGLSCTVNLIAYNPVEGLPFERPGPEAIEGFRRELARFIGRVTFRVSRGLDADAACGQLRARAARTRE